MNTEINKTDILDVFTDDYNPMVFLAKQAGTEVADSFMQYCGGTKPHIPTTENFWLGLATEVRDVNIRNRFDGGNYEQLGMEFDLGERQIRNIVHKEQRPQFRQADNAKALRFRPDVVGQLVKAAARYGDDVSLAAVANVIVAAAAELPAVRAALDEAFDLGQSVLFDEDAA